MKSETKRVFRSLPKPYTINIGRGAVKKEKTNSFLGKGVEYYMAASRVIGAGWFLFLLYVFLLTFMGGKKDERKLCFGSAGLCKLEHKKLRMLRRTPKAAAPNRHVYLGIQSCGTSFHVSFNHLLSFLFWHFDLPKVIQVPFISYFCKRRNTSRISFFVLLDLLPRLLGQILRPQTHNHVRTYLSQMTTFQWIEIFCILLLKIHDKI